MPKTADHDKLATQRMLDQLAVDSARTMRAIRRYHMAQKPSISVYDRLRFMRLKMVSLFKR